MPQPAEQTIAYPLDMLVPEDDMRARLDYGPAEVGRIALVPAAPPDTPPSTLPELSTVPERLMRLQASIGALQDERRITPLAHRHRLDAMIAPLKEDEASC